MIFLVLAILVLDTVAATGLIETIPYLPSKEVARGYSGLILTTSFTDMANGQCSWTASNGKMTNIFTNFVSCSNRTDGDVFVTCVNTNNTIFATLKLPVVDILLPLNDNNMVWNVTCDTNLIATLNVTVQNCIVDQPLTVSGASSGRYNTTGTFNCINNGELFYHNGTRLNIPETTCLYTAKWSGSQELECWKAPSPTIFSRDHPQKNSTIEVKEGNNLTLNCEYDDTYPSGNTYRFYFQDEVKTLQKNESASIKNLTKNDDGKIVSCQAVTPLTMQLNNTGRSNNLTIVVLYPPYENATTICDWTVNSNGSCNVTFYSKPKSTFIGLFKNGTKINNSCNFDVMENTHRFVFDKLMVDENDAGSYYISVNSSIFPGPHKIYFTINVLSPPTTPAPTTSTSFTVTSVSTSSATLQLTTTHLDDGPSYNSQEVIIIIISCAVVGSLVIIVLLAICCCFRKQRNIKSIIKKGNTKREMKVNEIYASTGNTENVKREMKDNELYASTDVTKPSGSVPTAAYGVVKKPKKKEKKLSNGIDNSVREVKENELYASTEKYDNTEREIKVNELYESTDNIEKVRREIKDNELYSSTGNNDLTQPYGSNHTATYAVANKPQKKKKTSITENNSGQPYGSVPTATYAVVNIAQKKKKT